MDKKNKIVLGCCLGLILISLCILIFSCGRSNDKNSNKYDDGLEQIDPNKIELSNGKVEVNFADILITNQKETRKLIVLELDAMAPVELKENLIKGIDINLLNKTQTVRYSTTGCFVVDLEKLTKDNIVVDHKEKTVTIQIPHAHLDTIEIDPYKIKVDDVEGGLFSKKDIKLEISDYVKLEQKLKAKIIETFDTAENGQKADSAAREQVKAIYEPIVQAIDSDYKVEISILN